MGMAQDGHLSSAPVSKLRRVPHGRQEGTKAGLQSQRPNMTAARASQAQCFALRLTSLRHDPVHVSAKESSARGAAQTAATAVPEPKLDKHFCRCSLLVTEDGPGSTAA